MQWTLSAVRWSMFELFRNLTHLLWLHSFVRVTKAQVIQDTFTTWFLPAVFMKWSRSSEVARLGDLRNITWLFPIRSMKLVHLCAVYLTTCRCLECEKEKGARNTLYTHMQLAVHTCFFKQMIVAVFKYLLHDSNRSYGIPTYATKIWKQRTKPSFFAVSSKSLKRG